MAPALVAAERAGASALAAALNVPHPPEWPPDFYDADDLDRMERLLADPANAGWALYYLIQRRPIPTLVGVAGYSGRPTNQGILELGYSVLSAHRRQGLATETVTGLVGHAFRHPAVKLIVAGSIGVLVRNQFQLSTESGRHGTLRYELPRLVHEAGTT